jgi:hypothetical protein
MENVISIYKTKKRREEIQQRKNEFKQVMITLTISTAIIIWIVWSMPKY